MNLISHKSSGNAGSSRPNSDNGHENYIEEWTFADISHLFTQIKLSLPDKDSIKYSTAVDLIDWNKIKFKTFTGAQCKAKLIELMESTRCFRTLSEIINDAEKIFIFKTKNQTVTKTSINEPERTRSRSTPQPQLNGTSITTVTPFTNQQSNEPNTITLRNRVIQINTKTPLRSVSRSPGSKMLFSNDDTTEVKPTIENGGECSSSQMMTDDGFNVSLENILKHTNWSQVVVNCGDKVKPSSVKAKKMPNKKVTAITKRRKTVFKRKMKKNILKNRLQNREKRPIPPFLQFYMGERKKLQEDNPEMTVWQIAALAGKRYRDLSHSSKEVFVKKYIDEKNRFNQQIKDKETNSKMQTESVQENIETNGETTTTDPTEAEKAVENVGNVASTSAVENDETQITENIIPIEEIKCEKSTEIDILENVQSSDIGKDYWGLLVYANENLCKLTHTKTEKKMDVISNLWHSLEEDEREVYINNALKMTYESREQMQECVFKQVNGN